MSRAVRDSFVVVWSFVLQIERKMEKKIDRWEGEFCFVSCCDCHLMSNPIRPSLFVKNSHQSSPSPSSPPDYQLTLTGQSTSLKYFNVQLTIRLILSSPRCLLIVCTWRIFPSLYATNPFCEKLYGKTCAMPTPSCSSCLGRSEPACFWSEKESIQSANQGVTWRGRA